MLNFKDSVKCDPVKDYLLLMQGWIQCNLFSQTSQNCYEIKKKKEKKTIFESINTKIQIRPRGPFIEKPRKLFGPLKPFSVHVYTKAEKRMRLELLLLRETPLILKMCE